MYSLRNKKVFVAGHKGMVGSAVIRRLKNEKCAEILYVDRNELDLRNQREVLNWMQINKPEAVFICAAKVGGIEANNNYPADFIYNNLMIAINLIHAAKIVQVEKLLFLGSSCIYPKTTAQPISEDALLCGSLEPTNEPYAIAKIAGIKLCQAYMKQFNMNFISAIPTSLYGEGDNFDLNNSHVIPALIRKIDHAKKNNLEQVEIWGTGKPLREFLYVDDCADALIVVMKNYSHLSPINIGSGSEISIESLTRAIMNLLNYNGCVVFNTTKPDGTPRKLLNSKWLQDHGWKPKINIYEGIQRIYDYYTNMINAKNIIY